MKHCTPSVQKKREMFSRHSCSDSVHTAALLENLFIPFGRAAFPAVTFFAPPRNSFWHLSRVFFLPVVFACPTQKPFFHLSRALFFSCFFTCPTQKPFFHLSRALFFSLLFYLPHSKAKIVVWVGRFFLHRFFSALLKGLFWHLSWALLIKPGLPHPT